MLTTLHDITRDAPGHPPCHHAIFPGLKPDSGGDIGSYTPETCSNRKRGSCEGTHSTAIRIKNLSIDPGSPCTGSGSDESSGSDDSYGETNNTKYIPPCMTYFSKHKRLQLTPSPFYHGCICGHHIEHRDTVHETRKRRVPKSMGVTVRPRIRPLNISFRE